MAGHNEDIIDLRTLQTISRKLRLVGNLRVILVEILGDVDNRLLDELQVTDTTHNDTQRHRIVGFRLRLIELGRDIELSYAAGEVCRTFRQGINLNLDARSHNLLLHLDIAGTSVEESLERIDVTVLLHHDALESDARNLELASHLREHHVLTPGTGAIGTPVEGLDGKALLLWQIHLLRIETLQVGHIATQLSERYEGIYLIGEQDRLLFVDSLLVGTHLDKEVGAGYLTACIAHLITVFIVLALARRPAVALCRT